MTPETLKAANDLTKELRDATRMLDMASELTDGYRFTVGISRRDDLALFRDLPDSLLDTVRNMVVKYYDNEVTRLTKQLESL